ncbi:uncharacterized protein LOC127585603 isoform X4 [Pristis pectinata]|uniref:uncharacterized protein LOC127585603 isoform X4 n=1 Tax=Pristis pectinata TaxID=685728 RepID=UPI00223E64FD|nr:uncharacterized protein LOC127585603 isoform X4 [Pristis pectinata]
MKFYHVRQKSSPKEQQVTVKELFATFFAFIFLTGSGDTCDFEGHDPIANYFESIEKLRINLPTDYNLTVLLQDTAGMDSCCSDLQAILSLNRSIGHIHRNSVGPLQDIVTMVIMELEFLTDCTVKESFNCEVTRWNSTHLLQNLLENLHSFKALVKSRKCRFNECILYTCTPANTSLINGTNSRPVNVSQSTVDDQSNANPTSLTISNEGYVLATRECRSQVTSLMSRIVAVVLVFSVFANAILLSCLVRKKRQAPEQITEMEPLSSIRVEHQELWSQKQRRRS